MLKSIKNKTRGFTIIEVLIVLAIAGLIMLIVFLAVPALRRNARNAQRTNDAAFIAAAINECLGNRNGVVSSCDSLGELALDTTRLSQLTTVSVGAVPPSAPASGVGDAANAGYGRKCAADGAALDTVSTPRAVAVLFNLEGVAGPDIPRCVET